jgi:hypothetical protein
MVVEDTGTPKSAETPTFQRLFSEKLATYSCDTEDCGEDAGERCW